MPTVQFTGLAPAVPEVVLVCAAMALLIIGVLRGEGSSRLVSWLSVAVLIATLVIAGVLGGERQVGFYGMFVNDAFAVFMKALVLLGSAVTIIMGLRYNEEHGIARFEFPVLVLLATAGMMVMISANDLITLYLGLELQSLALYVVASFDRDSVRSTEAGLKYFVLGALASGMLLYGASLVYGFTGTTSFANIASLFGGGGKPSAGLIIGMVFVAVGLAFKCSAVPFHMWTPDVYEGAPTPVTAFFSVAPKIAAVALFVRFLVEPLGGLIAEWRQIIVFLSVASMILGAVAAIAQQNIKRLMAYSSIGHIGYALIGLAAATPSGIRGVLVYMAIYLFMNIGTWAVILCMRQRGQSFFSKLYIFLAAIDANLVGLAVIGVVTSVVGAFYYLRIVKVMYFDEPVGVFDRPIAAELKWVLVVTVFLTMFFILLPDPIVGSAEAAAKALFAR
ncbi:MAG: NADH-quinone oxidoreductase subunit NuoN [Alphaproteobacteria bacterium]|nr:MAG: NADH-quinone oxidoreductase subunit NuoN [Alphaproteobacteria bacterium]